MAGVLKKSTQLTGLAVNKFAHQDLATLCKRILRLMEKFPKDYAYRTETEKIVNERLKIVRENASVEVVEQKIGCGQIEELILQAKSEMRLAEKMLEWKPWEKLMQEAPPNQWTWPPHK